MLEEDHSDQDCKNNRHEKEEGHNINIPKDRVKAASRVSMYTETDDTWGHETCRLVVPMTVFFTLSVFSQFCLLVISSRDLGLTK
jgi:hypothetical protein